MEVCLCDQDYTIIINPYSKYDRTEIREISKGALMSKKLMKVITMYMEFWSRKKIFCHHSYMKRDNEVGNEQKYDDHDMELIVYHYIV